MVFRVLKKSSKFYFLLTGLLCILPLTLSSIQPAGAATKVYPTPIEIRDCIPQEDAGIIDYAHVPYDTSFAVLIRSDHGIDLTAPDAIRFTIADGFHLPYERNVRFDTFRVVKLDDDPDDRATFLWAVYDRSLEPYMPAHYPQNSPISIKVAIRDVAGNILKPAPFEFKTETADSRAASGQNQPETRDFYGVDTDSGGSLDAGIELVEGELAGAKILYNSNEPLTPQFGPYDGIEKVNIEGSETVGMPLSLAPHTVFDTPVKLFIPVPEEADIFSVGLAYHDGTQWLSAVDADGNVLAGGEGWMVPGSRVDHTDSRPALIEVQVYHFSGVQAVVGETTEEEEKPPCHGSGSCVYASCFIYSTAGDADIGIFERIGFLVFIGVLFYLTPAACGRSRRSGL
jgi:hypothetical protein